jgi:hypothetical protein
LNVPNVKLFSSCVFKVFWLFYAFLLRMTPCTLHIEWFPWHQEPQRPQWLQQPQQPQWPQWPQQPHFVKKLPELDVSINPDTKMTYPGFLMCVGSLKIHYFIDFWHPFSWRLWRARNIKKIKTDKLGINAPNLWMCKIQKTSKNQCLYAHQSRITYHSLLLMSIYFELLEKVDFLSNK